MRNILTAPLSWLYATGVALRHAMFNIGLYKVEEFDIPIVVVGNITVGGTGKTPFTEYLVEQLSTDYHVAVLSRGYMRKTKGFVLASETSSFKNVGDEPKQIKLKFPSIPVAVCEKRVVGIKKLRELHPEVNLIILDDAFQHRHVEGWVNIVLMDYNCPVWEDNMLPLGRLRDNLDSLARANIFVITKCPDRLSPLDCRMVYKNLDPFPYQSLFFTHFDSAPARALFPDLALTPTLKRGQTVVAMTGIANPTGFLAHVDKNFSLIHKLIFADHYIFKMRDIYNLENLLQSCPSETAVVVTEKDAVKLMSSRKISDAVKQKLYYISVNVVFNDRNVDFNRIIDQYVRENQKYNITHPE
ncbi:MAG: tetraacyldisaccharide 4'-kinase [Mucinivorans sp.]